MQSKCLNGLQFLFDWFDMILVYYLKSNYFASHNYCAELNYVLRSSSSRYYL